MPLGRRKVPFSNKQKKTQLRQKRDRKRENDNIKVEPVSGVKALGDTVEEPKIHRLNLQPAKGGAFDSNRYRLHFFKETKEELEKKKQLAYLPVHRLNEETLEIDIHHIFFPGSELDIPKRPKWSFSMSKQEIDAQENKYFLEYVTAIENKYPLKELSYFELNLETWRQLWRVLEMSDIVFVVVDIRFPALLFSPALYHYITTELKKDAVLILNKIDLVPPSLVVAWDHYFKEKFPALRVICFTSFPGRSFVEKNTSQKTKKSTGDRQKKMALKSALSLYEICDVIVAGKVDLRSWHEKILSELENLDNECNTLVEEQVTVEEFDTSFCEYERFKDKVLTLGCIGQPNVGKSSVINALVGKKVVSVSRTPGHTKHFQTIFLTNNVRLCDCPGLVFPSKAPKPLQVLAGSYPIAQLQDPYSSVYYIMEHVSLPDILALQHPDPDVETEEWSAIDVCEAWAEKRGYKTARAARNDTYRAANNILRMALDGRICIYLRPPEYFRNKDKWENHEDAIELKTNGIRADRVLDLDSDGEENEMRVDLDEDEKSESDDDGGQNLLFQNKFKLLSTD